MPIIKLLSNINTPKIKTKFNVKILPTTIFCLATGDPLTKEDLLKAKWCSTCKHILSEDSLSLFKNRCGNCNKTPIAIPKSKLL